MLVKEFSVLMRLRLWFLKEVWLERMNCLNGWLLQPQGFTSGPCGLTGVRGRVGDALVNGHVVPYAELTCSLGRSHVRCPAQSSAGISTHV